MLPISSHARSIKRILHAINGEYTGDMNEFFFYNNRKQIPKSFNHAQMIDVEVEISNKNFIQIDTSDIAQLDNLVIKFNTKRMGDHTKLELTNDQKAITIRYVQASYLQEKGVL